MQRTFLLFLVLTFVAGAAQAEEKFQRKSGLWEVKRTSTRTAGAARVYQMCIDRASDNALRQLEGGMRSESCETSKVAREGDKVVVDAVCKVAKTTTATTRAVISGKFDSAYKVESKSTFDPPLRGKAEGSTVIEAKWTGACKPDQRPGDVIMPNGVKFNVASDNEAAADGAKSSGGAHGDSKAPGGAHGDPANAPDRAHRDTSATPRPRGTYVPTPAPMK
ncbi:MAG TPA: DUF3617 family protein [Casimicrobiaceae bacterium]